MKKRVHLICNAHIDPIWQWDWQEGVSAVLSTFKSAVNLAEKYDYIFCHNEVTVYKYVEEYAPELFEKIKQLVKEGKWHIIGGWYLQPDDNMPSGESFVRQIQMGMAYFEEKFGVRPITGFNVDAFGHTRGMVQIMKKCGQDNLIVVRPYVYEQKLECNQFIWEGFDGSTLKVFRAPEGYNTPLGKSAAAITERLEYRTNEEVSCILWGVGNHGGGPSDKDLGDLKDLMESDTEYEIMHSTPERFFDEINPSYRVTESLRISMPGCYTSSIGVKQGHIALENELYLTEIMCSVAAAKGLMEYPSQELSNCFEDLLNAEFHDVLPGSCVKAGEENGYMLLKHGLLDATRLKTRAYFALIKEQEAAKEGEYPIVVFNPHPYAIQENIECEFMLADQNWSETEYMHIHVLDGDKPVVNQTVKEESNINLDWRKKVIFQAELPPMSMKRYSVYLEQRERTALSDRDECFLYDDGHKYVEIDKNTGLLKSYRLDGVEYVKDGFSLQMFDDNPDPWGMAPSQLERLGSNPESFTLAKNPQGVFEGMKSIQVIEDGDIYLGIEAFFEKDHSMARVEYRIYKNNDDVDVNVTLFFQDINKIVKIALPVPGGEKAVGQTAFGTEELYHDGRENISQRFTAVEKDGTYVTLLDSSCYGGHYEDGTLYLSLVRGTTYCAHPIRERQLIPTDRYTKKMDQSEQNYAFRLTVCKEQELERKATEFNRKPYAVNVFPMGTDCKETPFDVQISDKDIVLATMKKADKRDGYILRLVNNFSDFRQTEVKVGDAVCSVNFGKYEVKTLFYNGQLVELKNMEI